MKVTLTLRLTFLALVLLTTGCKSMFPTEDAKTKAKWRSYDEAQAGFDKIIPHQTTLEHLKEMGYDPHATPNVKILTYLDLIERFIPNASITKDDLHKDVRDCIEAKDSCKAYELNLLVSHSKRYGNLFLDIFGFKKKTRITGWNFKALLIANDDVITYKILSGVPLVDRYEKKVKPLGPLQDLESILMKAATSGM